MRPRELERGKYALLESYVAMVPEDLDDLTPEERHLQHALAEPARPL